jgi:GAF domain-containing protein
VAARLPRHFRVADFPAFDTALHPDRPTVIEDWAAATQMSAAARTLYQRALGAESVIFAPLKVGEQWMGYLSLLYNRPRKFTEAGLRRLMVLTGQAAVAINSLRLFQETRNALAENASLFRVSRALASVDSLPSMLEAIVQNAMPRGAHIMGLVRFRYDAEGQPDEFEVPGMYSLGRGFQPVGSRAPIAQHSSWIDLVKRRQTIVVSDVRGASPLVDDSVRADFARFGAAAVCLVPLNPGGRPYGAVIVAASQPLEFAADEVAILNGVADLLAVTLGKLELADETQRRAEQLAAAAEIGRAATASFDLPAILAATVNLIRERFGFYHASIFIIDPGSNMAEVRESTGEAGRQLKARKHRLAVGSKSLVGTATATREPVVVQDVRAAPSYYPNPLLPETRAEAVIPLIASDSVVGALDVQSTLRGAFAPGDIAILATVGGQLAVAIQNARLFEQTSRWANRERLANQITTKIRSVPAGDIDGILRTAVTELRQALGASRGAIQLRSGQAPEKKAPILEVQYCEKTPNCPFFNEKMANFPESARAMKSVYCLGDKSKCARYRVATTMGPAAVPPALYPNDTELADAILNDNQPEAKRQP